ENWQKILNKCSLDLIALTIEGIEEDLTELKQEISTTKNRILSTENPKSFIKHSEEIDSILSKHKTDTLNRKLSKFKHDTIDYLDNKVYNWQFHRQRPNVPQGVHLFGRNSPANSDSEQSSVGSANNINFLKPRRPGGGGTRQGEARDAAANHPPRRYPERERRPWRRDNSPMDAQKEEVDIEVNSVDLSKCKNKNSLKHAELRWIYRLDTLFPHGLNEECDFNSFSLGIPFGFLTSGWPSDDWSPSKKIHRILASFLDPHDGRRMLIELLCIF
ncbi:Hypothetical predicted protein, partial [Pelobates cultripes]